jgi:hypothetical protein
VVDKSQRTQQTKLSALTIPIAIHSAGATA